MTREEKLKIADILGLVFGAVVVSFLFISLFVWVICWAFGFEFAWKYVLGVWVISAIIQGVTNDSR